MLGRKLLLMVFALAIASLDTSLLTGLLQPERQTRAERRTELEKLVTGQNGEIRSLQTQSDDARDQIYQTIELLTDILNVGRQPTTAGQPISSRDELDARFQAALAAKQTLPELTKRITTLAGTSRANALELREFRRDPRRQSCLKSLSEAMKIMVESQVSFAALDTHLIQGFAFYEDLYSRTKEWFAKQDDSDFRTIKQSADWYTVRTASLVGPIQQFRSDLAPFEGKATEAGVKAKSAFDEVEKKSEAVSC